MGRVGTTRISEAKEICKFGLEHLVLTRELTFGEALKRVKSVRAADLAQSVQAGELTFDAAYARALLKAKVAGRRRRSRCRFQKAGGDSEPS